MTRTEQIELWKLEAIRPRLEVQARFMLELQRRGLRPNQVQFTRMWRRKRVEAHFHIKHTDFLLKAHYLFPLHDMMNHQTILMSRLERR